MSISYPGIQPKYVLGLKIHKNWYQSTVIVQGKGIEMLYCRHFVYP